MSMNQADAAHVAAHLARMAEPGLGNELRDSLLRVVAHLNAQIERMNQPLFNPSAFPVLPTAGELNAEPGMSLRDYFAAKAMAAHVMRHPVDAGGTDYPFDATMAEWAYAQADAMLKERDK